MKRESELAILDSKSILQSADGLAFDDKSLISSSLYKFTSKKSWDGRKASSKFVKAARDLIQNNEEYKIKYETLLEEEKAALELETAKILKVRNRVVSNTLIQSYKKGEWGNELINSQTREVDLQRLAEAEFLQGDEKRPLRQALVEMQTYKFDKRTKPFWEQAKEEIAEEKRPFRSWFTRRNIVNAATVVMAVLGISATLYAGSIMASNWHNARQVSDKLNRIEAQIYAPVETVESMQAEVVAEPILNPPLPDVKEEIKEVPKLAMMEIPSIELRSTVAPAPIEEGEWQIPKFEVGQMEQTDLTEGLIVLGGHVESISSGNVFKNLDEVKVGDKITFWTEQKQELIYVVTEIKTIDRDDMSIYENVPDGTALIMTCTGKFIAKEKDYSHRHFVIAQPEV